MQHPFTENFMSNPENLAYLKANMMGPNAMRLSEEMADALALKPGMRVLDLGCGRGLSTLLLVKKYGAQVFAGDLWVPPTENYERFVQLGIDDLAIPLSADAAKGLPFASGYFDVLFTVDAYHYFGDTPEMLPSLVPFVKKGGKIAIAVPGIKREFGDDVPEEMRPSWNDDVARTIHSLDWWSGLWHSARGIQIDSVTEMSCCEKSWDEWHESDWPDLAMDIAMRKAENGQYYNLIQMIATVL